MEKGNQPLVMEFIINGKRLALALSYYESETIMIEATSLSDGWKGYLPGHSFITLKGQTEDGETIEGKYHCVDISPDRVAILRSIELWD
ncbi:MAG TPA: hypothetical protein PLC52_04220 [Anaerolineales bacterium]|nr:hypothetical protein [Anaerolineales bacterium]HRQ92056.1 hypothetical protein [Anaerolineales bacterium]